MDINDIDSLILDLKIALKRYRDLTERSFSPKDAANLLVSTIRDLITQYETDVELPEEWVPEKEKERTIEDEIWDDLPDNI